MDYKENNNVVEVEVIEEKNIHLSQDELDEIDLEILLPSMNVGKELTAINNEKECIIGDSTLVGLYDEILSNCRDDRTKVDEVLSTFLEMVINDGDASSASKEAIVNLIKIKSDTSDKMSKVADLMTRIKLKEKDTFPRYLSAQQKNKVVIEGIKRDLLKSINKLANKKGRS